ncbi:MAG TPA: RNA polymerase sigma factor RpoH, partial [Rhodospirillales bacterium]|nr:RNA polymerase sigma factor RpoH [Rhodospirillales bacterium]
MTSINTESGFSSGQGLSAYLRSIREFPMLEKEEEFELARRIRKDNSDEAVHALVNSHLRLAAKIAMGYRGYGLPLGELVSEGNLGLMKAVRGFDPERGFRLATYAMWWIRAAIQEYILRSWSLVKMGTTAAQKKLFFNLRKVKTRMRAIEGGDLPPDQVRIVAETLNVSEQEVINMNRRLSGPDHSLNAPMHEEGEGDWLDILATEDDNQEVCLARREELDGRRKLLDKAMKDLTCRECDIFRERRLMDRPKTLDALSHEYGISRERVRQIENRAFEKVSRSIRMVSHPPP